MAMLGNDNFVLCEPIEEKTSDTSGVSSFFTDNRELLKLKVVFTSKYPDQETFRNNKLYEGDTVYVAPDFAQSNFNTNVYTLNGVKFIRVPFGQIILIDTIYTKT